MKREIIEKWAKEKIVEEIVRKFVKGEQSNDLIQIIYLALLEKDEEEIERINSDGSYRKYIAGMVSRQIMSYKSAYYYEQRKLLKEGYNIDAHTEVYEELADNVEEEDDELIEKVKEKISSLTPMEKDILLRLIVEYHNVEYIEDLSEVYGKSKRSIIHTYYKIIDSIYYSITNQHRLKRYQKKSDGKIIVAYKDGIKVGEYSTVKGCSEEIGIKVDNISKVLCGKIKATKYKGEKYTFKYERI